MKKAKILLLADETEPNFHFAPTKHKTNICKSHLAVGKLGRKLCPVDCVII